MLLNGEGEVVTKYFNELDAASKHVGLVSAQANVVTATFDAKGECVAVGSAADVLDDDEPLMFLRHPLVVLLVTCPSPLKIL